MIHDKTSRRPRHNKRLQKDENKFEAVLHFELDTMKNSSTNCTSTNDTRMVC